MVERQAENLKVNGSVPFLNKMTLSLLVLQFLIKKLLRPIPYLVCISTLHHEPSLVTETLDSFNFYSLNCEVYYACIYWVAVANSFRRVEKHPKRLSAFFIKIFRETRVRGKLYKPLYIIRLLFHAKVVFWKPLFKKTSYFGFFNSARFFTKNTFQKKEKKKK